MRQDESAAGSRIFRGRLVIAEGIVSVKSRHPLHIHEDDTRVTKTPYVRVSSTMQQEKIPE